jgi:hypothetical protein
MTPTETSRHLRRISASCEKTDEFPRSSKVIAQAAATIDALTGERDALREALTPFVKSIIVHWDDVLRAPPRTPVTINGITKAHVDEARSLLSPPDEKRG